MTAYPELSVRVAFASDPLADTPVWTEIGPVAGDGPGDMGWVRSIATKRGRQQLLRSSSQFQAGTATVGLDNRDARFYPLNTAGPYYPDVEPGKLMQIGATWAGTFYPMFTGFVDDWPQDWPAFSEGNVPLAASDMFNGLSLARLLTAGYSKSVLSHSPVAYYRLGGIQGAGNAADSSGHGHAAQWFGTPTLGAAGCLPADPDTALDCSSGAGLILPTSVLPSMSIGGANWMITFWVNWTNTDVNQYGLIDIPTGGDFELGWTAGGIFYSGNSSYFGPALSAGWHRVDLYLRTSGLASLAAYLAVDGQNVFIDGDVSWGPAGAMTLGAPFFDGGPQYTGLLDEVAIYTGTNADNAWAAISAEYKSAEWLAGHTGDRVNQVLDTLNIPAWMRNIDTGYTAVPADQTDETQTEALTYLQNLEQTEQGQCYVSAGGQLTFEDRYRRYISPDADPIAVFGDGGPAYPDEIPYNLGGLKLTFDRGELYNEVPVTRRNGNLQQASDQASIDAYRNRTMPGLSDLLMATDTDALYCAEWILADTKDPDYRISDLVLNPMADERLWPLVLGAEVGNVITINKHNIPGDPPALTLNCRIEGIDHQIDAPRSWQTTWHLSRVGTQPWFILNDPVMGILDSGARWGW